MTVSKRDIQLLIGFIGFLAAVCVYFFVYQPTIEKTEELEQQNRELSTRVSELEELMAQKDFFLSEIIRQEEAIRYVFDLFPPNVMAEDAVQSVMDVESKSQINVLKFTYNEQASVYSPIAESVESMPAPAISEGDQGGEEVEAEDGAVAEGEPENNDSGISLMLQPISYTFESDLAQFKRAAEFLKNNGQRDVINNVSLTYDNTTGLLVGDMTVNKYYISGTSKEYALRTFSGVKVGTNNIFSTYIQPSESDTETEYYDNTGAVENEEGDVAGDASTQGEEGASSSKTSSQKESTSKAAAANSDAMAAPEE